MVYTPFNSLFEMPVEAMLAEVLEKYGFSFNSLFEMLRRLWSGLGASAETFNSLFEMH